MRQLLIGLALCAAVAPPVFAAINTGGGIATLYYCHDTSVIAEYDAALEAWSNDRQREIGFALGILALRELAVITDGDGVGGVSTAFCGDQAVGRSEWRFAVDLATLGNEFVTAWAANLGYIDVDPADGFDDATGLTEKQMVDAAIKTWFKNTVNKQRELDQTPPADAGEPTDT